MRKVLKTLEFWFDYHFAYFLYKEDKRHRYFEYMENKWGDKK